MNKPKIKQKLEQSFSLSPQQLIKANILQLNAIMLEARLYKELESNPALEIDQSDSDINTSQLDNINQDDETSIEDEENQDWDQKRDYDNSDFLSNLSDQATIADQVLSALRSDNLSDEEIKISEQITGNLDDQGYLKIDPELISDRMNISKDLVIKWCSRRSKSELQSSANTALFTFICLDF